MASNSEINNLYRIATAVKTLDWVKTAGLLDKSEAISACEKEIKDALNEMDWAGFDPRASLEYYMRKK
jgi:hypothetical protein